MEGIIRSLYGFEFSILGFTINFGDLSESIVSILKTDIDAIHSGDLWDIAEKINAAVLPIAYSLLAIFCLLEIIHITLEIDRFDWKRIMFTLLKYVIVKGIVKNSMYFVLLIMNVCSDIFDKVYAAVSTSTVTISIVDSLVDLCDTGGFFTDIFMFLIVLIFWIVYIAVVVAVIGIILVRIAKIAMFTSISPIPLASLAHDSSSQAGKNFFKGFFAVCLEASFIYLSCIFYGYILSSMSSTDSLGNLVGIITANSTFLILLQTCQTIAKEITGG